MASKQSLEKKIRDAFLASVSEMITQKYETDALPVSASELTVKTTDEEGNEKWVLIKVSVPRGTRNGNGGYIPYNGKEAHEEYMGDLEVKAFEKEEKEKEKQRQAELKKKKKGE